MADSLRFHDVVILTDGHELPIVTGVLLDGADLTIPLQSEVKVGADANGTMTVTFTVFARSVSTSETQAALRLRHLQQQPDE